MKKFFYAVPVVLLSYAYSFALSPEEVNTIKGTVTNGLADVTGIAIGVFGVLAGIWGIRKIIKLLNKS